MTSFLLSILIKTTVVLVAGLLGARVARRARASVRHLIVSSTFAVLLVLPAVSWWVPAVAVVVPAPIAATLQPVVDVRPDSPGAVEPRAADTAATPVTSGSLSWSSVGAGLGLLGGALCLFPVGLGLWQTSRLRSRGIPWRRGQEVADRLAADAPMRRRVDVLLHSDVTGPITCGVIRPAIVFPDEAESWSVDSLTRALVHEREHVRRLDWLTQTLARVVCAFYWFHPLVWTAWRRLSLEAERACDDAVLRRPTHACDPSEVPTEYADQLLVLARRLAAADSTLLAMANRHDLSARVRALLDPKQTRGPAATRWVALAGGIAALLVTVMSPLRIVAEEAAQTTPPPAAARFDAATIKPCSADEAPPGPARGGMGGTNASFSPGRMNVPCVTLEQLIYLAYAGAGAPMDQQLENVVPGGASDDRKVRGGPAWVHSQHNKFAVEGAAAGASDRYVLVGTMLQSLLEERFRLKVHRQTEEVSMFAMTVAKGGLKIKPMQPGDCAAHDDSQPFTGDTGSKPTCGSLTTGANGPNVVWNFAGFKLSSLAARLSGALGAYVSDRTGVTDEFLLRLEFHPDESTPGIHWAARDSDGAAAEAASIFTALDQQVGVKIEKMRGPRGFIVIDHVEPLSPQR